MSVMTKRWYRVEVAGEVSVPWLDMRSVVEVLVAVGGREMVVLLRSRGVVCRGGIWPRSSFSALVAVLVRDKVIWPFSDMAGRACLGPDYVCDSMRGVYAAQC